ncbi:hypothetical protein LIER_35696 [Lithospermum erythrorhizon]|uniref:Uncharacterized protein n=1 Tax=Lithospermum erythrorhizon TaxID=34254 RepID=A0AAV3NUZ2_LITER
MFIKCGNGHFEYNVKSFEEQSELVHPWHAYGYAGLDEVNESEPLEVSVGGNVGKDMPEWLNEVIVDEGGYMSQLSSGVGQNATSSYSPPIEDWLDAIQREQATLPKEQQEM